MAPVEYEEYEEYEAFDQSLRSDVLTTANALVGLSHDSPTVLLLRERLVMLGDCPYAVEIMHVKENRQPIRS